MAVEITRMEVPAADLRREAAEAKGLLGMLALAVTLQGRRWTEAAESRGMDRQALRDQAHRSDEEGLEGLADRPLPGRMPMLDAARIGVLGANVEAGPGLE